MKIKNKKYKNLKIAICQPYVILGGRLQVIIETAKSLNKLGIKPTILTLGSTFDEKHIIDLYGSQVDLTLRKILRGIPWKILPQDIQILIFNFFLRFIKNDFDLFINSSNSQIFLPKNFPLINYIHFPRERRIFSNTKESQSKKLSDIILNILLLFIVRPLYILFDREPKGLVICNSKFTRDELNHLFPTSRMKYKLFIHQ